MRAAALDVEIPPLNVHSAKACFFDAFNGCKQIFKGVGGEGGHNGGHTLLGIQALHFDHLVLACKVKVIPPSAVRMYVYKAGQQKVAAKVERILFFFKGYDFSFFARKGAQTKSAGVMVI